MEITINIDDYLSEGEIKEIAVEQVRHAFSQQLRSESDINRVLVNLSYEYAFKLIDDCWSGDLKALLVDRVESMLEDKSCMRFVVFNEPFYPGDKSGIGTRILNEEKENLRPLIREMAEKHIREYPFDELDRDEISNVILDCIEDKLFGREEEE